MVQMEMQLLKDLGLQREVMDALPYAVVGGAYEGSLLTGMFNGQFVTPLNYVVPHGQQLKILFLRVWTQEAGGARFSIVETNPTAAGQTGTIEAYPVVGSVPSGVRDYPMLEAPGAEVLRGSLKDPIHVLEGSITFNILAQYQGAASQAAAGPATGAKYGIAYWGVIKVPEAHE